MESIEEIELFNKVKEGNQPAFEKLFKEHYASLCRFAYRFLEDKDQAEEIVQEVFCKIWDKRKSISFTSSFKSYIFTSVRNTCYNVHEHMKVRHQHQDYVKKTTSEADTGIMEEVDLEDKIDKAVQMLPEQCRKVFVMNRFEGLKYKEIAGQLGISPKTVENQMGKALKIMREQLKDYLTILILVLLSGLF